MIDHAVLFALLAFALALTGYFLGICLSNQYTRKRWKRKIMCFCNNHRPDRIQREPLGRSVQRCMYCDKVLYEYETTKDAATKEQLIRRIY